MSLLKFFPQYLPGQIQTAMIRVTPEIADYILEKHNHENRNLSRSNVSFLQKQMENDTFEPNNGQSISFDADGRLSDGQHRLSALSKSGKTYTLLFVFNVPVRARETIDTGKNRNIQDALSFYHESKNIRAIGSAVKIIIKYQKGDRGSAASGGGRDSKITNSEAVDFVNKNPKLIEFCNDSLKLRNTGDKLIPPGVFCAAYWLIYKKAENKDLADEFFHKLATGIGLRKKTEPIYALRKKVTEAKSSRNLSQTSLPIARIFQAIVQMWNAHVKNNEVKLIRIKNKFPDILAA